MTSESGEAIISVELLFRYYKKCSGAGWVFRDLKNILFAPARGKTK